MRCREEWLIRLCVFGGDSGTCREWFVLIVRPQVMHNAKFVNRLLLAIGEGFLGVSCIIDDNWLLVMLGLGDNVNKYFFCWAVLHFWDLCR